MGQDIVYPHTSKLNGRPFSAHPDGTWERAAERAICLSTCSHSLPSRISHHCVSALAAAAPPQQGLKVALDGHSGGGGGGGYSLQRGAVSEMPERRAGSRATGEQRVELQDSRE